MIKTHYSRCKYRACKLMIINTSMRRELAGRGRPCSRTVTPCQLMMGCLRVGQLQYWGRGKAYVGMQTCTEQSSAGLLLKHLLARLCPLRPLVKCQPQCPALTCTDSGRKHREGPCTRAVGTALCQPNARMSQVCGRSRFLKVPTKTLRCCSRRVNCCPSALPRGIIRRGYSGVRCVCSLKGVQAFEGRFC